jgi:hypothetical protein
VGSAVSGCYNYVPIELGAASQQEGVRLRVTESAAARIAPELGVFSTEIDAQFARDGADSISVGIPVDRTYRGSTIGTSTQTLFLARSEVVEVRRREFSRSRTILVSAGTLVGFGILAAGITQLVDPNGPSSDSPPPPPPPGQRLPRGHYRFTVRIPIP